ncbi:MAG TPA: DUF4350 domain-containing protein [Bacteroidales bacterium]|nr:DUF4350 domain-containing protein [Bacteroidales bacterium]
MRANISRLMMSVLLSVILSQNTLFSQVVVSLDNWFNNEMNAETKRSYHYTWSDTAFSGYSQWGNIFRNRGAVLATMSKPATTALWKTDIYIIVDPDSTSESPYPNYISTGDISSIRTWVRQGGVLAVLANDGPNCEFTNLNRLMSEFGMTFNHVSLHTVDGQNWEKGASVNLPDHPLFKGVSRIYMTEISDINISGTAKPVLTENGRVLIAENKFGRGYVIAVGDPWIYNEYIDHALLPESFQNRKAAENLTDLLISYVRKK